MKKSEYEKYYEEERQKILLKAALDIVNLQKDFVFAELLDSGLSGEEITEVIDAWRRMSPKKSSAAVTKKKGILVLQGVAACLNEFEILAHSAAQKTPKSRIALNESLANMGRALGRLAVCAIRSEGKTARREYALTTKAIGTNIKAAGRRAISQNSKHALDMRHAKLREFKEKAKEFAIKKWAEGSTLVHHKMKNYLVEECHEYPFMHLPGDPDSSPDKVLLAAIKQAAIEIGRPDLISGKKIIKKVTPYA